VGRKDTHSDFYRAIVDGLVAHRKEAKVTQWELARRLKTDQSQISKFERGERRLDIVDYLRICEAIGIDPGKLLKHHVTRSRRSR
jgi:transcriptional regulator with XRE-family HTH domain